MSDDPKPPAPRGHRGAGRAARAYRKARRLAAKAGNSANQLKPARRSPTHAGASAEKAAATRQRRAPDPEPGVESYPRQRGAVKTGFLFGFGFAAGTALFRLILILIFYGFLAALGYWAYSRYVAPAM